MSYTDSKNKIDAIRREYGCKGDLIFRTAIQNVVDYGKCTLLDKSWYDCTMDDIDANHDYAEEKGKILFCTREFEKAIVDCSVALCDIPARDLLIYIQREVWLGGEGVDYHTAISLLVGCVESIAENHEGCHDTLEELYSIGFDDYEIEELGHGYLLDAEEDEE